MRAARDQSYQRLIARLETGCQCVLATLDVLDDRELLDVGAFGWAGKWPISRWISLNTARQYNTARTFVRRALRERRTRG